MAYSSSQDRYSKLTIEVDVNDQSLKIFGGDLISIQSQLRLLRRELTVATDPKEILILNNAVNQLQQQLLLSRERSRDLFGALSLLPGPIGSFAFQAERAFKFVQLLVTTPLSNWGNQFKSIFGGLTGSNFANIQNVSNDEKGVNNVANVGNAGAAASNAIAATTNIKTAESVDKLTESYLKEGVAVEVLGNKMKVNLGANSAEMVAFSKYAALDLELQKLQQDYDNLTNVSSAYRASKEAEIIAVTNLRNSALAETEAAMQVTKGLITQKTETLALADAESFLTKANTSLINGFKQFVGLLGTLAGVGVIAAITAAWVVYKDEVDKVTISNENLNRSIENNKELLALDEASLKRRTEMRNAVLKAGNASDRDLQKEAFKDATEAAGLLDNALLVASKNQQRALDNVKRSDNGLLAIFGIGSANEKELKDNLEKADKQVNDLEAKSKDAVAKQIVEKNKFLEIKRKEDYNDALRNLDAQIANEIEKYNTDENILKRYYTKRNKMVDDFNVNLHLSTAEREERARQQQQTINAALIDDKVKSLTKDKAEIDAALENEAKETDRYYDLKILQANKQAEIEQAQAGKNAQKKEGIVLEAETKLSKELDDIYLARLNSQLKILKEKQASSTEYTDAFYQNELNIINKNEKIELDTYEGNEKMQTAIKAKYDKERMNLQAKQLTDTASIVKRLAENITGDYSEIPGVMKQIDKKYKLLKQSLELERQAKINDAKRTNGDIAAIDAEYNKKEQNLAVQKLEEKQGYYEKIVDLAARTGAFLSAIGDAEMQANQGRNKAKFDDAKKIAVAGIWLEKAAAIGSIYISTAKAVAKDVAESPLTFGEPWATVDKIIGVVQAASVVVAGATAASAINGTDFQPANVGAGKNYGTGGMIYGAPHSQGGVPITAEGGEAVMSRGAVTAFAPLLSLMNQAGGGTAFSGGATGQARYDHPKTINNPMDTPIVKTYVVESDLTTMQHKAARLKELSVL